MTQVHVPSFRNSRKSRKTLFRHRRAPRKVLKVGVADITKVIDADFAGKESVGGELAKEAEELNSLRKAWIVLRVLPIGDQVKNLLLLPYGAIEIRLFIAVDTGIVEPHQPAAKRKLIVIVLAGKKIDEFRSSGLDRALRLIVGRNDGVAQTLQRFIGVRGKEFWRVCMSFRSSLFRLYHAVRIFGGLEGNHAQNRSTDRRHRERFEDVSP